MKRPLQIFNLSFQNKANDEIDIHIDGNVVDASTQAMIEAWFGDTTSTSYRSFRNSLNATDAKVYNVIINSPGGHVGDALAIHDLLVDLQNKGKVVNTIGRGIVASSATLILLAGKKPTMSANSWFMMHTVSGGTYGTVSQIENYAVTMRKFNDKVTQLYSEKSGMPTEEVTNLMNAETWLTATEAEQRGLVSTVTGNESFQNFLKKEDWAFQNTQVLNLYNQAVKLPETNLDSMKEFFTNLKNDIINAVKGIKPAAEGETVDIANQIATAVAAPFENLGTTVETAIAAAVETATTAAVTKAVEPFEARIKTLEDENKALTKDIENKIGQASSVKNENPAVVPIGGSFN